MECYQDVWNIVLTFTNQFTFLIKIFRISEAEFQEIVKVKDANGGNDGENSHDDEKMYILD